MRARSLGQCRAARSRKLPLRDAHTACCHCLTHVNARARVARSGRCGSSSPHRAMVMAAASPDVATGSDITISGHRCTSSPRCGARPCMPLCGAERPCMHAPTAFRYAPGLSSPLPHLIPKWYSMPRCRCAAQVSGRLCRDCSFWICTSCTRTLRSYRTGARSAWAPSSPSASCTRSAARALTSTATCNKQTGRLEDATVQPTACNI